MAVLLSKLAPSFFIGIAGYGLLSKTRHQLGCLPPDTETGAQECWQDVSAFMLHLQHLLRV
jgi:hypothetical protein